jgi:hypothetical protein
MFSLLEIQNLSLSENSSLPFQVGTLPPSNRSPGKDRIVVRTKKFRGFRTKTWVPPSGRRFSAKALASVVTPDNEERPVPRSDAAPDLHEKYESSWVSPELRRVSRKFPPTILR